MHARLRTSRCVINRVCKWFSVQNTKNSSMLISAGALGRFGAEDVN